jgi:hypothetical protein
MADEVKHERSVSDELSKLGKQFSDVIRTAWESDDRKKIQDEIIEGLQKFGDEVTEALQKAAESEPGKQVASQAEKVIADVKESNVAEDVRKGLLQGMDALNRELGKLSEKLEKQPAAASEAKKPPEAEATEEVTRPSEPES